MFPAHCQPYDSIQYLPVNPTPEIESDENRPIPFLLHEKGYRTDRAGRCPIKRERGMIRFICRDSIIGPLP